MSDSTEMPFWLVGLVGRSNDWCITWKYRSLTGGV